MTRFHTTVSTLVLGVALLAGPAFAQSTGSVEFDHQEIVVTGSRLSQGVSGVVAPDSSKSREVLTQEFIKNQRPGQTINDIINMLPGVSFQNNDAYGSSGGTMTIRGFDNTRISQTFDGMPLNDTGNYALYSNQQLDPELIEQVNVNLGTTDVDSPSAAASGSTVNYRSIIPTEDFHVSLMGAAGDSGYFRVFGLVNTGVFTSIGTRAWVSASHSENYNPFNHNAKIDKQQYNAKIYQPIGDNGDFVSIAGHFNMNRNNNFSSLPLRVDQTQNPGSTDPRVVGSASSNRFPVTRDERDYTPASCQLAAARPGVADTPNSCGTFDQAFNPSDTGNIRMQSRFTLTDKLVLTVDPSFQYTKANGGNGNVKAYEYLYTKAPTITTPLTGYIGGNAYMGRDLNGDGDTLDAVTLYAPSHTQTNRYGLNASLRYDFMAGQSVRLIYTFDRGRHRQTGPLGYVGQDGFALDPFPIDNPILDGKGNVMQKRNRKSFATLNQVGGEYRGEFLDSRLTLNAGIRAPFFKRDLNNFCVTESGGNGFVDCFNGNPGDQATFLAANPSYNAPLERHFSYNKVLPSAGATFDLTQQFSVYASYTKGLSVPGTDNLYNSFSFPAGTASPVPETTDNFETGLRYRSSKIQAMLAGWYTIFTNRLASAYNPELDVTIYRNLGKVDKYGLDGSIAYQPIPEISVYAFGSYLKSKIKDNVQTGVDAADNPLYAATKGKRESGAPTYTFGGRVQGNYGPIQIGIQAKRTGPRYVNDQNLPVFQSYTPAGGKSTQYQVYGAKTPAYTLVDLDARISLEFAGLNDRTYLQLNVTNLFDKLYVSGFTGGLSNTSVPFAYVGAPRTFSAAVVIGF